MNTKISLAIFSMAILAFAVVGVITGTGLSHDTFAKPKDKSKDSDTQQTTQGSDNFNNQQYKSKWKCIKCS